MSRISVQLPYGPDSLLVDGQRVPISASLRLRNHSPTGFSWGYGGSGPAQTALAILLHVTGDPEVAERHYQAFKFEHVCKWPQESFSCTVDVEAWVAAQENAPSDPDLAASA